MQIPIVINNEIIVTFDKFGNIYFSPINNPNELYEIIITNKNTIYCDKYINDNDPDNYSELHIGELQPFYNNETLRGKIIREIDEIYEDRYDSDDEYTITEDVQKIYMPENFEFNEYINKID